MAVEIIKRGEGVYLVRIFLGLEGGKTEYHSKTIHGSRKDAQRYNCLFANFNIHIQLS